MSEVVEQEIRTLRAQFWSGRDPEGRAFAPLADAYRRKGELEEAVSLVEDGLARLPEFTPGHLVASRIHRARGDLIGARSSLDRVLGLDPENVFALLERAEVAREGGDRDSASTDLRRLLELDPGHMGAKAALARLESAPAEAGGPSHQPHGESEPESTGTTAAEMDPFDFGLAAAGGSTRPGAEEPSLGAPDANLELDHSLEPDDPLEPDEGLELDDGLELDERLEPDDALELEDALEPEDAVELEGAFEPYDGPGPDEAVDGRHLAEEPEVPGGPDLDEAARLDDALDPDEALAQDPPDLDRPELLTRTMAELFAKQGLHDRAVEIYERLLEGEPDSLELAARLDELRAAPSAADADGSPAGGEPETAPPHLGGAAHELPFEEVAASGGGSAAEPTIREHFADLLSWTPGALPIERLHPGAPPERAPAGSRVWAWAQGAVPIEDLAPDAPLRTAPEGSAAAARVSADAERAPTSRAPEEPEVPAGMTAEPPEDASDTTPDENEEGTAASVRTGPGDEERDDEDLDDFRAWLESLGP